MNEDAGTAVLRDLMRGVEMTSNRREMILASALRNAGILEAPTDPSELHAHITGPLRAAAFDLLGATSAVELISHMLRNLSSDEPVKSTKPPPSRGEPVDVQLVVPKRTFGRTKPLITREFAATPDSERE